MVMYIKRCSWCNTVWIIFINEMYEYVSCYLFFPDAVICAFLLSPIFLVSISAYVAFRCPFLLFDD